MPTVAIIGPELFPIPPIRGGAAELFIEQVASRLTGLATGGYQPGRSGAAGARAPGSGGVFSHPFIRMGISAL